MSNAQQPRSSADETCGLVIDWDQGERCALPIHHDGGCAPGAPAIVVKQPARAHYLGTAQFYALDQACRAIETAFHFGVGTYLVGSALERPTYRDVDIRTILHDADFDRLFTTRSWAGTWNDPTWSLLCAAVSEWLSSRTGLLIDWQIQRMTEANAEHGGKLRNALGRNWVTA